MKLLTTLSIGGDASWESMAGVNRLDGVEGAYSAFKQTEGTWNNLMAENLDSVSVARYGNMWVLEGSNKAVIIDANNKAPEGYVPPENPIENMTTEEAVDEGLLELKNSTEGTDTYASPEVSAISDEEAASMFGEDW